MHMWPLGVPVAGYSVFALLSVMLLLPQPGWGTLLLLAPGGLMGGPLSLEKAPLALRLANGTNQHYHLLVDIGARSSSMVCSPGCLPLEQEMEKV